ncbi:MAG: DMT family transporter [Candidatus Babeliales bacterium]
MIRIVVLYMLFALTFILGKMALFYLAPIFFISIRMILAGFFLILYLFMYNRKALRFDTPLFLHYSAVVLFHIYGAYILEFVALQHMNASRAALLYSFFPFMTYLLSVMIKEERLHVGKLLSMGIGFLGIVLLCCSSKVGSAAFGSIAGHNLWYDVLLLGSVVCAAIGWIIFRLLVNRHGHSYVFLNGMSMLVAGIMALGTSYGLGEQYWYVSEWTWTTFGWCMFYLLLVIGIANCVCYNLYGYLLTRFSSSLIALAGFLCPLFSVIWGNVLLGETCSIHFVVAFILVSIGLVGFYCAERGLGVRQACSFFFYQSLTMTKSCLAYLTTW